eukprot:403365111
MNKKTLFIGGGLFTVLLGIFATVQTFYDQSSFTGDSDALDQLGLQKTAAFQQTTLGSLGAPITISTVSTVTTPSVTNLKLDRLNLTNAQSWVDLIDETMVRIQAYVVTDKIVYRNEDAMFIEVFLFNALTKTPYVVPAASAFEITVNIQDQTYPKTISGLPSISFIHRVTGDGASSLVTFSVTSDKFADVLQAFQIRTDLPSDSEVSPSSFSIVSFNEAYVQGTDFLGKFYLGGPLAGIPVSIYDSASDTTMSGVTDSSGGFYFSFTISTEDITSSTLSYDIYESGSQTTLLTYTIASIDSVVTFDYMELANYHIEFMTYSNTGLVLNVTQNVYFYSHWLDSENTNLKSQYYYDFTGASIKSYNIKDTTKINTVQASLSTTIKGYGTFQLTPAPNTVYFVEVKLAGFESDTGNDLGQTLPLSSTVILAKGVIRIPIKVSSIYEDNYFMRLQMLKNKGINSQDVLKLFSMTQVGDVEGDLSKLKYNYADGLFSVYLSTQSSPLMVFNQVPNPANFTSKVLFNWQYTFSEDNSTATVQRVSYNLEDIVVSYNSYLLNALQSQSFVVFDDAENIKPTSSENIFLYLADVFPNYIDGKPYVQVTVYGTYGPIDKQITGYNGYSALNTEVVTGQLAEATFSFSKRIIGTAEALTINILANSYVSTSQVYYLAIKNHEKVIAHRALTLKAGATAVTIAATEMPLTNGGVLTANLYRVDPGYFEFQTDAGVVPYCKLRTVQTDEEYSDELNSINDANTNVSKLEDIVSVIGLDVFTDSDEDTVDDAHTLTCLVLSPAVVSRFLVQIGSASFYKRPATNVKVDITPSATIYQQGQEATIIVKVSNMATNAAIANGYVSLLVSEDNSFTDLGSLPVTLTQQVFTYNEFDLNAFPLDPAENVESLYKSNVADSTKEKNIDLLLATQLLRASTYEIDTLDLIDYQLDGFLLPHSNTEIGMLFGGKFSSAEEGLEFKQTQIQNYYGDSDFIFSKYMTGVNRLASVASQSSSSYYRSAKISSEFDKTTDIDNEDNLSTTPFANSLPDGYDESLYNVLQEKLYYRQAFKSVTGTETFKFRVGDLKTNYKVQAIFISDSGVGQGSRTFQVKDILTFTANVPTTMVAGESYNATITINNFSPNVINAAPGASVDYQSGISGEQMSLNFSYFYKATTTSTAVLKSDFYIVPANSTYTNTFVINAGDVAGSYSLDIDITGDVQATNKAEISRKITYTIQVLSATPQKITFAAEEIGSRVKTNPVFQNSSDFTFMAPALQADLDETVIMINIINSYEARIKLFIDQLLVAQSPLIDAVQGVSHLSLILNSLEQTESDLFDYVEDSNSDKVSEYTSRVAELKLLAKSAYSRLSAFQVRSTAGVAQGYNQYRNAAVGNLTVTAYALKVISRASFLDDFTSSSSTYQQNLAYLVSRRDGKGGYIHPVIVDATTNSTAKVNNAFITDALLYTAFANGSTPILTTEVASVLSTATASFKKGETSDTVTSDPYYLAVAIQCLTKANADATLIQTLADQLQKHFLTSTGQFKMAKLNDTYTVFNAIASDRITEISAQGAIAFQTISTTKYADLINRAQTFIRRQAKSSLFGNPFTSAVCYIALSTSRRYVGANSGTLVITANDMNTSPDTAEIASLAISGSDLSPITVYVTKSSLAALDGFAFRNNATNKINFKINVDSPASNVADFAISYVVTVIGPQASYTGHPIYPALLTMAITPSYATGKLGAGKVGDNVAYTLTLTNLEKTRVLNAVEVVLRPSACLAIDTVKLDALVKTGAIHGYVADYTNHELAVHIRQIYGGQVIKPVIPFTQKYMGVCKASRTFTASFLYAGFNSINVTPAF